MNVIFFVFILIVASTELVFLPILYYLYYLNLLAPVL